ncbi:retrotransposon protein, putative, ty1-copia subclass [Tanacetum coccineum]
MLDMVRSMMSQTTLPKSFWDYALESVTRILKMVPTKKVYKTSYEIWHGQAPKLSYLKVWGCDALVKRDTLTKPDKLEPRSIKSSGSLEDLEIIQKEDTHPSIDTSLNHEEDDQEIDEPQSDVNPIRKSSRTRRAPDQMCLHVDAKEHELGDLGKLANYKSALLDPESDKWLDAMNVEMQSMKYNEVWDLVDLPPDGKTVGSKWLFKKKTGMDGAVHTFKALLVAKGFTQTYGVDYEETFSPVADIRAIKILIAIAAFYDYEIWQIDVKTAFLNGHLSKDVYMVQPEGFVNPKFPNRNSKRRTILMQEKLKLSKSQGASTPAEKQRMQNVPYASAVGSIMYALRCELHWATVKSILKYLRNTKDMFLFYEGDIKRELRVSCYTDAGYLTDADDLKSQTRYVFVLNGGVVDWKSTKQIIFATSSTDAEYIVAFDALKEAVWIQKFISGLGVIPIIEEPINMYCDNTRAISISKYHGITKGARHFRAKVYYI